jgi:hypothetical protein
MTRPGGPVDRVTQQVAGSFERLQDEDCGGWLCPRTALSTFASPIRPAADAAA